MLAFLPAGCDRDRDRQLLPKDTSAFPSAHTEPDCEKAHGAWHTPGPYGRDGVCMIPTPDAGAKCADSDDCASFCVVEIAPEPLAPGDEVIGRCLDTYFRLGCHELVEDGRYNGTLCID